MINQVILIVYKHMLRFALRNLMEQGKRMAQYVYTVENT